MAPGELLPPLGVPMAGDPQQEGEPSMDLARISPGRAQEASQPRPEISPLSLSARSDPLL